MKAEFIQIGTKLAQQSDPAMPKMKLLFGYLTDPEKNNANLSILWLVVQPKFNTTYCK